MEDMEQKLGAILNDPGIMQQLMSMAQTLSSPTEASQPEVPPSPSPETAPAMPEPDAAMLGKLVGLAGQSGIDANQKALLKALAPYLSQDRIRRLERAMRAAKTARLASSVLGQGGLSFLTGR